MKKNTESKSTNITDLKFKDKEEFLKWREKILENYEQSKIDYQKEMSELFGYDDEKI